MKTLVLNVDRDDDIGVKTGIVTPVTGREANLNAAVALGLADPEESDTNSIFGAISLYDKLIREEQQAEVATIAGDKRVGRFADLTLGRQLDEVIAAVAPTHIILVNDGASDQQIMPVLTMRLHQSHVRLAAIHEIIVRQHRTIESTWYIIWKALLSASLGRPMALTLVLIGMLGLLVASQQLPAIASQAIPYVVLLVLGLYWAALTSGFPQRVRRAMRDFETSMHQARISVAATLFAVTLLVIGALSSYNAILRGEFTPVDETQSVVLFLINFTPWAVGAALLRTAGTFADRLVTLRRIRWASLTQLLTTLTVGFVLEGLLLSVWILLTVKEEPLPRVFPATFPFYAAALLSTGAAVLLYQYIRRRQDLRSRGQRQSEQPPRTPPEGGSGGPKISAA